MSDKEQSPFDEALDLKNRPVVDPDFAGMPGLPDFSKPPYTEANHDSDMDETVGAVCDGLSEEAKQMLLNGGVIERCAPEFEHAPTTPEHVACETAKALADVTGIDIPKHWEGSEVITQGMFMEKGGYAFDANFVSNVPDYYVSNLRLTSMTHYYPFHVDKHGILDIQDIDELLGHHEKNGQGLDRYNMVCAALKNFFTTVKPAALATGCAMTYQGFAGPTELTYIRFERDHVDPMTFVVRADTFDRFIEDWHAGITDPARQQRAIDWALEFNSDKNMQEKGFRKRVCQIAREYPLSWLYPAEKCEFDGLLNGDFQLIDDTIMTFASRFSRFIGMATKQAEKLAPMLKKRDHNLVLTFKGNKTLDGLVIGLDKVPPRLENGEFHLGETPINLDDWHQYGNSVVVIVRKITKVSHWVEQLIKECKASLPDHPYAQSRFAKAMKEQLLASSHFIKELYQINPNDIRDYVEQVANEMVGALNNHGGNIGLDLNTWKVYQYQDNGLPPVPLVVEELNFRKNVYEVHTDRFMECLYTFMYGLSSPYIRPYTHKVVVDGNDGIKIGSIRHVKEAGDPLAEKPVETLKDLEEPVSNTEAIAPLKKQSLEELREESWENMKNE